MYKIAVIGDRESILGFSGIGMDVFPAYDEQEAKQLIQKLAAQNYGIIYITEKLSLLVEDEIEKYRAKHVPAIITIPGNSGSMNIGANKIKEYARKAVGIDIVFKDDEEEESKD